jgi:hypothetical protein
VFYQQENPIARQMRWNDDKAVESVPVETEHAWKVAHP